MRKGQLTLFIIIGLVVLVILGILLMPKNNNSNTKISNQDSQRVTQYVQSCLQTTGKDALKTIGSQGGYYTISQFKDSVKQTETQIISIPPQKIVMWHEVHPCESNPNGCIGNNRPKLCKNDNGCPVQTEDANQQTSMQEELEKGINAKIDDCLQLKTAFNDVLVEPTGKHAITATIKENEVLLDMNYPLKITTSDKQTLNLNNFHDSLDIKLPQMYRFATQIQRAETQSFFLENIFMHIHSVYSGIDQPIPPIRDMTFTGMQTQAWSVPKVRTLIEQDMLPFMNFIQVLNAQENYAPILYNNNDSVYGKYANGFFKYMTIKTDNVSGPYAVQFEYPNTPIYLEINKNQNGVVRPTSLGGGLGDMIAVLTNLRITQYKFKYDVSFPMLVHVTDAHAFNNEGFQLDLGLEGNIVNNNPLDVSAPVQQLASSTLEVTPATPDQLVNHIYKITVKNKLTGLPIKDAIVAYECDAHYEMGITNVKGLWAGKLPYCFGGGAIVATANETMTAGVDQQNNLEDGATSSAEVDLWPIKTKQVLLYKRMPGDYHIENISGNDTAVINLQRIKNASYEEDMPVVGVLTFGNTTTRNTNQTAQSTRDQMIQLLNDGLKSGAMEQSEYDDLLSQLNNATNQLVGSIDNSTSELEVFAQTLDLVPGNYELDGMLMYNNNITIPSEKRCAAKVLGVCTSSYTLNQQTMNGWLSGGASLKGANAFSIDPQDLYSNKTLVLYVVEQPIPANWDMMMNNKDLDTYLSYGGLTYIKPEFK